MQERVSFTQSVLLGLLGLGLFIGLWYTLSVGGIVPRVFLPSPGEVIDRFSLLMERRFAGATLLGHLAASFERFTYGFLLAAFVGIPLGLMMGWYRLLDEIVSPLFDALRFVAPIAWVPFAALWFGTGIGGPIMIIFAGAFPPCVINAYRGAKFVDPRLIEAANMLGTPSFRVIREVLLPSSVPSIISGLRVSAGLGWQSLVGAELIVASAGVGYLMVQGQANVSTATVMSGMIAIGVVGLALDSAIRLVERIILRRRGMEQ